MKIKIRHKIAAEIYGLQSNTKKEDTQKGCKCAFTPTLSQPYCQVRKVVEFVSCCKQSSLDKKDGVNTKLSKGLSTAS